MFRLWARLTRGRKTGFCGACLRDIREKDERDYIDGEGFCSGNRIQSCRDDCWSEPLYRP